MSKFFSAVNVRLVIKNLTTSAYYPQTNGQVEHFNRKIVARLQNYVSEHQSNHWEKYVRALTYTYNRRIHRSMRTEPVSLVLSCQPPGPTRLITANTISDDLTEPPEPISFQKKLFGQRNVPHKQTGAKQKTDDAPTSETLVELSDAHKNSTRDDKFLLTDRWRR